MALIRPITWAKGQNVTAALLNQYWRDNLNGLHWLGAYQTSDLLKNNDSTLANLPGLSFPVVSGDEWIFGAHSFYVSSAAADAKWAVTGPGSSTLRYAILGGAPSIGNASATTFGTGLAASVPGVLEDNHMLWGYIQAGGNGTIQLQAAQNTPTAVDTRFRQYSPLVAFRLSSVAGTAPIPSFSAAQQLVATNFQGLLSDELNAIRFQKARMREEIESNNIATPQNLTDLAFDVRAGETWAWFSWIYFISTSAANIAFAATAPFGTTGRYGVAGHGAPTVAGSTETWGDKVSTQVASTTNQTACFNGLAIATRDGRVQLQGCQATQQGVVTSFFQDSNFIAFRLAP